MPIAKNVGVAVICLAATLTVGQINTHSVASPVKSTVMTPPVVAGPEAPVISDPLLAALVAKSAAKIHATPKSAIVPSDKSYQAMSAIRRGDYKTARRIANEVLSQSRIQRWGFYPFDEFLGHITYSGDDSLLLEHLNDWIQHEPEEPFAYLIRAEYYRKAAWTARGTADPELVPRPLMARFIADLARAATDVSISIKLNPTLPYSYSLQTRIATTNGNSDAGEAAFHAAIKAFPNYYEPYRWRLYSLTPKWGGSIKALNEFVAKYAGDAPDNSPMKLLYLTQYAFLVDAAVFDCNHAKTGGGRKCVDETVNRYVSSATVDGVIKSLNLYKTGEPTEFNSAAWPILGRIILTANSGSAGAGALLQQAATIMGSDNRLSADSIHNSYVLDDLTARSWENLRKADNAEKLYLRALQDIEQTTFPDEQRKIGALAWVYDDLANFAENNRNYVDEIAYQNAADMVGGNNHTDYPYRRCYAYYKLKYFADAISECTRQIEGNGNGLAVHFWRARSFEGLGDWDRGLADYTPIADSSDNSFRVSAIIAMSAIVGTRKGDIAGELSLLNRYPFVFDPKLQRAGDLAIVFNNRCYANMELGKLKDALDDCTESLKYDRIPDAYQKKQELMKRMGINSGS